MSKVDFTKPVRLKDDVPYEVRVIAHVRDISLIDVAGVPLFANCKGQLMRSTGEITDQLAIENIPETHVDYSQGVLDNPLKVPWKAWNHTNQNPGCYIRAGNTVYYASSMGNIGTAEQGCAIEKEFNCVPNQWPIPASALGQLAEMTKDELPEGVELKNTIDDEQSSAYCFVDGKIVGMICHDSSLKTGFVAETLSEAAIYKHKRSSDATYTWADLVRIRDEFRAKRKAVKVEMKIEPEKDLSILTIDYVNRKDITSCTVTTSGLAAEVGAR